MGGKNMCEVMECLRGVSLEGPPKITKKRVNGVETTVEQSVPFNAYSMALLLAIAFRCNDGSEDSKCWSSNADLGAFTHAGESNVKENLKLLVDLGFINRYDNVRDANGKTYERVFELNHAKIKLQQKGVSEEDEGGRNTAGGGRNTAGGGS